MEFWNCLRIGWGKLHVGFVLSSFDLLLFYFRAANKTRDPTPENINNNLPISHDNYHVKRYYFQYSLQVATQM